MTKSRFSLAALLLAIEACSAPPMKWERSGVADTSGDEADCGARANAEAAQQLPYGDGPPIYGLYSEWSMLTWKQEIDNQRYYLARDLTRMCMQNKGYQLAPASSRAKA